MQTFFRLALGLLAILPVLQTAAAAPPNILFAIADDWGLHAGAYGTPWIRTPAFDRVAMEGVLFENAWTPMAKCAPSRAIVLTGRNFWQLEEAGNHLAMFPAKFRSWPEALTEAGWHMGFTGKGWGPGIARNAAGVNRQLTGKPWQQLKAQPPAEAISNNDYAGNFRSFLDACPEGRSWCFWYGSTEPHRRYEFQAGATKGGLKLSDIDEIPAFWPDNETVRHDMLDYAFEVEHTDRHLGLMLQELESRGLLDSTLIIVTSDHGMPFPRVKGYASPDSNRIPFAVRFPEGIEVSGRRVEDYINFTDLAPTILDYAGISASDSGMRPFFGRSLRPLLESSSSGQIEPDRNHVLIGKERTDVGRPGDAGYPIRGIVTAEHVYLHNYEPDRWPAGNPETGYLDTDGSPLKTLLLERGRRDRSDLFWQLNFGKRPSDELYQRRSDPYCVDNLAVSESSAELIRILREQMESELRQSGDPRMFGQGRIFDNYRPTAGAGFHEQTMNGKRPSAGWVNPGDFEPEVIE